MKLIIEITVDEKYNRRRLNNHLADAEGEIHDFIIRGSTQELSTTSRMGVGYYDIKVKIEE